jgi:hypothetical protein
MSGKANVKSKAREDVLDRNVILKADRLYEPVKSNELGYQTESQKREIPVGKITFDTKVAPLSQREGAKEWLMADFEHYPKKIGYEVGTWMALGLIEQDPDTLELLAVYENAGVKEGTVFGA